MSDPEKRPNRTHAHYGASNERPARTRAPTRQQSQIAEVETGGIAEEGVPGRFLGMTREYSGWDVYNNEAKKVDTELVNDWRDSLNSLLLFAAIFAAVLTAFIIESKHMLEQDPTNVLVDVMIFNTNNLANGTHTPYTAPEFQPSFWAITVNCLFFASLSTSLVAALASVVALQWVADYDAAITRGGSSPEDRAKRRQFRYAGVIWWKMSEIIAALPLLIYCSVALFFAGLIVWMLAVHQIVGLVTVGGSALAVAFYGISTVLSVLFVSAPFRTPLGRWIHSSVLLFSSLAYHIAHFLKLPFIPTWLTEHGNAYALSRRREDIEVDKRPELGMRALVWLASQLSVSQDSYDRLLLLVGELPNLKREIASFPGFSDAPWFSIFDLLGRKNLKNDQNDAISPQEMEAFAILTQCYRIPEIHEIVSPNGLTPYSTDAKDDTYWSQYCSQTVVPWLSHVSPNLPNSMFLLLRDIPLPSIDSENALELTIRLSRWRNSPDKIPKTRDGMPEMGIAPSTTTLDHSIVKVGRSDDADDVPLWFSKDDKRLYITILGRMIPMLVRGEDTAAPAFLDALRWRFEILLLGTGSVDKFKCLSMPLLYRDALEASPTRFVSLHSAFTLLLARNLRLFSGAEKITRVKEVITMMWSSPFYHRSFNRMAVKHQLGMEKFFEANKTIVMGWIQGCDTVQYIQEILHSLALAQAEEPQIGPLWRSLPPQDGDDPRLIEALVAFTLLIRLRPVTPAQHYTLIDLVCRDLAYGPAEAFKDYFTPYRLHDINKLPEPCLRLLGQSFAGSGGDSFSLSPAVATGPLKDSWARIAEYFMAHTEAASSPFMLKMQATLWSVIPRRAELCSRALLDPKVFVHLQCMFEYPIDCSEHYHGEGHLLLHILDNFPTSPVDADVTGCTSIPLQGRKMNLVLVLLMLPDAQYHILPDRLLSDIHTQCLGRIMQIGKVVRRSQLAMLSLMVDLSAHLVRRKYTRQTLCSEELAGFSLCVRRALELPRDPRVAFVIARLVENMMDIKRLMYHNDYRVKWENQAADREASFATSRLMALLASMMVFGGHNRRILSCAQTREMYSPAVGWMPIYTD